MRERAKYIITFLTIIVTIQLRAQGYLHTSNKQIVDGTGNEIILRGIGLGGWMLQEGYMMQSSDFANTQHELKKKISDLIGEQGMEDFYDTWLKNYICENDVDSMAAWGFNSIRLPLHYNLFTLPIEEEPGSGKNTWLQKGFDLTDSLLKWCSEKHIYLILDLHAAPGGQGKDQAISDYDPSKPSLWESAQNWKKTVSLWKKLAERYANEPWIGGYDLINETNWDMQNNSLLKNLYLEITDSIRLVDQNHILFIEGNWFANDFTGLTPPWDNNMVYSFHKYWTFNTKDVIQWMIDIRNIHNVPVWLGESGENSNTWFNECIKLAEENDIGWAWWPWKKISSIAGPLSATKTPEYETLLNYWKGSGAKPSVEFATNALMQMAENLKMENIEIHYDVMDAMFRQVHNSGTRPYANNTIPGLINASDFDMGRNGEAYYDNVVANYHLSTNTYTAWNSGWAYRNDGVDIEPCNDVSSNGYNVGFIDEGEWMVYTVNTSENALYSIDLRVASNSNSGILRILEDGNEITGPVSISNTGGWQNWSTVSIDSIILKQGTHQLKLLVEKAGFNINGFDFIKSGNTNEVSFKVVSAITGEDGYTIHLYLNKPAISGISESNSDFRITVNGTEIPVGSIQLNPLSSNVIDISVSQLLLKGNTILVSYSGNKINSDDGTLLLNFSDKQVYNVIPKRYQLPAKIQAEDYYTNSGLTVETCSDTGGGKDLGYTDAGDYLDYLVTVSEKSNFTVTYRVAALSSSGQIELQLVEDPVKSLHIIDLPVTNGWQTWTNVSKNVELDAGTHKIRVLVKKSGFNLNWFEFDFVSGVKHLNKNDLGFYTYPNPARDKIYIKNPGQNLFKWEILDMAGKTIVSGRPLNLNNTVCEIDISSILNGYYILKLYTSDRESGNYKISVEK
ncbi:MAG: carbohydrate-binding protein [Bacteroidales bacterium]